MWKDFYNFLTAILKTLADNEGYETFVIPDNVGGRYSVLTAVGLLPITAAGINIDKLMKGAKAAQDKYSDPDVKYNDCYKYAVVRNLLYRSDKKIEILANYEPKLHYFTEWWKQLYGESERLSTVRNAKAIMVLDHGRIIERGDHKDLIAQKGVYYKLYTGAFELE